ncbi:MAG TPA: FHA domain-containing protein [Fredinandcohnia sp.]|nr:FHA domain-containing protein [Fredinandcohnia sp.]
MGSPRPLRPPLLSSCLANVNVLLAELDLVCPACDALAAHTASFCPRCGGALHGPHAPTGIPLTPFPLDLYRPGEAELVVLRGATGPGERFAVPAGGATLGRNGDIPLAGDPFVAPLAASVDYRDGRLLLRVEAGAVYLRIGGQVRLGVGDEFAVGDHLLRLDAVLHPDPRLGSADLLGSPRPSEGVLFRIARMLPGGRRGRIHLLAPPIRIGRRLGELLLPEDRFVSGRHCALYWDGDHALLEDLSSSNGTFVRLPSGVPTPLHRGDTLRLGQHILRLR